MGDMFKSLWQVTFNVLRGVLIIAVLALLAPRLVTAIYALTRLYTIDTAPYAKVAVVFGAGVRRDGSPTPILRDRVATAADLYFQGKVEKLLMSGGSRFDYYSEPEAMKRYAISLGIPAEAIVIDNGGQRTYDSCYRAKAIFGLEQAILVTQSFHLPRALYTCRALGLPAVGVAADRRAYRLFSLLVWNLRELPATLTAFLEVHLTRPRPVLEDPKTIFPVQSQ